MSDRIIWRPNPGPQERFMASPSFEVMYGGAAGGGKTDALLYGSLRDINHPKYRALILRRTLDELQEIIDRAQATFAQIEGLKYTWQEQKKRFVFRSGAAIQMGYLERKEHVQRYQGRQWTYIGFDEIGNLPDEKTWVLLLTWCRSPAPELHPRARCSANPGGPGHAWLKKRYVDACPPDGTPIQYTAADGSQLSRAFFLALADHNPKLLENDPTYLARLAMLPPSLYEQLRKGNWSAGAGLALPDLDIHKHIVPAFQIPGHWFRWGSLDWGYAHPFFFGDFAMDERGNAYLVESVHGHRLQPWEQTQRILSRVPIRRLRYVAAGRDAWHEHRARGEATPTIAEQYQADGIYLKEANIDRKQGLNNMRLYIRTRIPVIDATAHDGFSYQQITPRFRVLDTVSNRKTFECLESMVEDPDDREDALKVDADPETGEGGDDPYDGVRYGLAERPIKPDEPPDLEEFSAFSGEALDHEHNTGMRARTLPNAPVGYRPYDPDYGE